MELFKQKMIDYLFSAGPKLLLALIVLVVGHFVVKLLLKIMTRAMTRFQLDASLIRFFGKAIHITLHTVLILSALSTLGVSTTGLLAALSAAAVAVSLALKDSLSNIAAGILLLVAKPFSTGDFIEVGGKSGTVMGIDMINTVLLTLDNRRIIIPNGQLAGAEVINYSKEDKRRVDLSFSVSYGDDVEKAKTAILACAEAHPLVLSDPDEPFVRVGEYADSAVNITVRVWCKASDYWTVHFDLLEQVRAEFDKQEISIPFNQLDVHVINEQ